MVDNQHRIGTLGLFYLQAELSADSVEDGEGAGGIRAVGVGTVGGAPLFGRILSAELKLSVKSWEPLRLRRWSC
jgi:hypothetical protein